MMESRWIAGAAVLLAALTAAGCGSTPTGTASADPVGAEAVGLMLRSFHERNKPSPRNLKEVEKNGAGHEKALEALRSGDVVIYWGVNLDEYGGSTAVGYEKKTPESGGLIILGDGSVAEVSAAQFKDVPKPPESRLKPSGGR